MGNDSSLVASLAVVKSLFSAKKGNIHTIILLFCISAIKKSKITDFSESELVDILHKEYEVDVPNALIRKILVEKQELFRWKGGKYHATDNLLEINNDAFETEIESTTRQWESILEQLYSFVKDESTDTKEITPYTKNLLKQKFIAYIQDKKDCSIDDPNVKIITKFIVKNESNASFVELINDIREGVIIYSGIRHSDSSSDRKWKKEIDFYLDVQYLFSAFGLNSDYHKKSFFDFHNLVSEINRTSEPRNSSRPKIRLWYFQETKREIDNFFGSARMIVKNNAHTGLTTEAMEKILSKCREEVDVIEFQSRFYSYLKNELKVNEAQEIDLQDNKEFLLETEELTNLVPQNFKQDDQPKAYSLFRIADNINILRKGKSSKSLEECGAIFLTDSNIGQEVSKFLKTNSEDVNTSVFQRMEWFTCRMWYLMNNGVLLKTPDVTFDIISKAKLVVSSLCQQKIADEYDKIKGKQDSDKTLQDFYNRLRSESYSVDSISEANVAQKLQFAEEDVLAVFQESQKRLVEKAAKADSLQVDLDDAQQQIDKLADQIVVAQRQLVYEKKYGWFVEHLKIFQIIVAAMLGGIAVLLINSCLAITFVLLGLSVILLILSATPLMSKISLLLRQKCLAKVGNLCQNEQVD